MALDSQDARNLRATVNRYSAEHRHPGRPQFVVHEPHTMASWEGTDVSFKPGCYALYSSDGELLYVGKASNMKSVGSRLVRFRYNPPKWDPTPEIVQIIEVIEPFEAPSLEEFLIAELQPRFNDHGIRRRKGF